MKFLFLEPFVPSGDDFKSSKALFLELGFRINWDAGDYIGLQRDECRFVLQNYQNREFAENLMISVKIDNAREFWEELNQKELAAKFSIKLSGPAMQPYGVEVTLIDLAGVCWHFVE